jgi:S-DNA-T family DNA segregation ATPase FtsK/SpoIIIE
LRTAAFRSIAVTTRPSAVGRFTGVEFDAHDANLALALAETASPTVVLVDDAERMLDTPAAGALERFAREARDGAHLLVVAGTTDDLAIGFRGFVVEARRSRCGVLLAPRGPLDGEVFGVRLPRETGGRVPPGRGLLIEHGAITPLQVAAPTAARVTSRR